MMNHETAEYETAKQALDDYQNLLDTVKAEFIKFSVKHICDDTSDELEAVTQELEESFYHELQAWKLTVEDYEAEQERAHVAMERTF